MKERTWIRIDGLELHHLAPAKIESRSEKSVWASLLLGPAFSINGLLIHSRLKQTGWFSQGWGNTDTRLIDVPALHKDRKGLTLLEDVLAKAVHDFCLQRAEVLRPFIEKGTTGDELSFGLFKPEAWRGKSLMIPVDFIRLQNFQSYAGRKVSADIQIGHHLIFWRMNVWDKTLEKDSDLVFSEDNSPCGVPRIAHDFLRQKILQMLDSAEVQKTIRAVAKGTIDMTTQFLDVISGCEPEATPPAIIFQ
jgi:hypothetical protein